jgi:hypothetical protein
MRQAELFFAAQEERVRGEVATLAEEEMARWRRRSGIAGAGDKAGGKGGEKASKGWVLDRSDERLAARLVRDATALKVQAGVRATGGRECESCVLHTLSSRATRRRLWWLKRSRGSVYWCPKHKRGSA